jgi:TrmH family RNA methyltransferase
LTRRPFIASSANGRLKAVRRLARGGSSDVFVAEGARMLRSALAAGLRVREVYAAPSLYLGAQDAPLVAHAEQLGARVVEVDAAAFRSIARHVQPDGVVALVERPSTSLGRLELPPCPLVVVAIGIERPGNLGTIVRTACAAGADAVVVADPCTDPFHRDVVRGSVGTIFHMPVAAATTARTIAWLRAHSVRIIAATPAGAKAYCDASYEGGAAVALGCERHGLPEAWLHASDATVAIPMTAPADSLNVAVAAGVVLFEARRQRAASPEEPQHSTLGAQLGYVESVVGCAP